LLLTEKQFLKTFQSPADVTSFLQESVEAVSSSLCHVYPETSEMQTEVKEILLSEVTRYIESSKGGATGYNSLPQLLIMDFPALSRIKKEDIDKVKSSGVVDGAMGLKW